MSNLEPSRVVSKVEKERENDLRTQRFKSVALKLLFYGFLVLIWHLFANLETLKHFLFPTPLEVLVTLWNGISDKSFVYAIYASMKRLLIGYLISLIIGLPLGLCLGRIKWMDETIGSLSLGLQALPSICWLPLAILWFGLNEIAIQFVIIMGSILSITLTVRDGVISISPILLKAAQVLGASKIKLYTHVLVPASLPYILTGARLGWTFAWRSLMAAELLYVSAGLGSILTMGRELHDMAMVISAMLIIIGIGLFFDKLIFGYLEHFIAVRWGTK
ncbi:MAG: ABC transporter permease [Proteobacteria bacterium]|nr:ABC transporter permease [Pseudomonadota bacterium]